jgi:hypothetical protein
MSTMKITLDAAMRARDVSPPAAVDQSAGDGSTGVDCTGDGSTGDGSTGDGSTGGRGPEAAARGRAGGGF